MNKAPTARFSDRVENYARYRPGYPLAILDMLARECGLQPSHVIADIASGTGIFPRLLLENGNFVFAVEPNPEMREMGNRLLEGYERLVSVAGTAEETTLRSASVDFVTAAQAAHWFDLPRAPASTPFLRDYEQLLLTYGTDYQDVRHEHTTDMIPEFFAPAHRAEHIFRTSQQFDYQGVAGRLSSSSY